MTTTALLRITATFLVLAGLLFGPPTRVIRADDPDPQKLDKEKALHDAAEGLKTALGAKQDALWKTAQPFLAATKDPANLTRLKRTTDDLQDALDQLKKDPAFGPGVRVTATTKAIDASLAYQQLVKTVTPTPTPVGNPTPTPEVLGNSSWADLILPIAGVMAGAVLIVLLVFGVLRLRRGYWVRFDHHVSGMVKAHTVELKQRQDELVKHVNTMANQQQSASTRLESIENELQALGRRVRAMTDGRGYQGDFARQAFDEFSRSQPVPVEPEFPAAVSDYLNKMKRNSTVVKPDFQNGILVSDLDGKGELVLVRDTRLADGAQPLFLVPRVGQFQTKQEFHSYYERYYECQRPSAGDVWIIDPAIVSTVPGGWELREKGVLEVR